MPRAACQTGGPSVIALRAGDRVRVCGCGRSGDLPRCDRAPEASGCAVREVTQARAGYLWLCGCGRSAALPLCDGSHKRGEATLRPA